MSKTLNLDNKMKKDIESIKNKIQTTYAFILIIISSFIIIMNIALLKKLTNNILDTEIILTTLGALISIPIFWLQDRMNKATKKQLKISNYILNFFFIILAAFFVYSIYSLLLII